MSLFNDLYPGFFAGTMIGLYIIAPLGIYFAFRMIEGNKYLDKCSHCENCKRSSRPTA